MNGLRRWLSRRPGLHIFAANVRHWLTRCWMRLCWIRPVDRRKVVFVSYYGRGFGDNGKAIALSLLEKCPELDLVWAAAPEDRESIPASIRFVPYRSMAYYREMATAAVWLDNSRKSDDVVKRRGQYYIQTWHGGFPLKKIEQDSDDRLAAGYLADAKHDSEMADLIISSSSFFSDIIRRAFWYDGEILECGTPRLDTLFHPAPNISALVKERLGIPRDRKVILYAPTFRDDGRTDCYNLDFDAVLRQLHEVTRDEWVFAVRLHPNIAKQAGIVPYSDTVYNATGYPDMYEVMSAADCVITDYSSLMFEAALVRKPVFLYAADLDAYMDDRGFYFDIRSLPFPLAQDVDTLLNCLRTFDIHEYYAAVDSFRERIGSFETSTATNAVVTQIQQVRSG